MSLSLDLSFFNLHHTFSIACSWSTVAQTCCSKDLNYGCSITLRKNLNGRGCKLGCWQYIIKLENGLRWMGGENQLPHGHTLATNVYLLVSNQYYYKPFFIYPTCYTKYNSNLLKMCKLHNITQSLKTKSFGWSNRWANSIAWTKHTVEILTQQLELL